MSNNKLGKFEAVCLMVMIVINVIVLNIPNMIMLSTGSSAIINITYISLLGIFFSLILSKLFERFAGKDIIDISEFVGGKFLKTIICMCFLLFILLLSIVAVRYLSRSIKIIYFNKSPLIYILLFFIIPAVFMNKLGLRAISSVNCIFIFIVLACLIFLLCLSYENFSMSKMFPILGNGLNATFISGITNIFVFTHFTFLFLIPSLLNKKANFKKVAISSTLVGSVILLFCIATFIFTLPMVTESDEMLSIYLLTRMVGFGNFVERFDAIFIFSWIITLLSSLSIAIFYIIRILSKMLNLNDEKILASPVGLTILGGSLFIKNYPKIKYIGTYIYRYGFIFLIFGIGLGVLVAANLKLRKR